MATTIRLNGNVGNFFKAIVAVKKKLILCTITKKAVDGWFPHFSRRGLTVQKTGC